MLEPFAEMLVQYETGRDAISIVRAVVEEWQHSGRQPLVWFGRSGPGIEPSEAWLRSVLTFNRGQQEVAIALRTSRSLVGADRVRFYFTNPEHCYSRPPNFVAVSFFHEKLANGHPGYGAGDLVSLLSRAVTSAKPTGAWIERYEVLHHPQVRTAARALAVVGLEHLMPFWISLFPPEAVAAAVASIPNVTVLAAFPDCSALVQVGEWPFQSADAQVVRLLEVLVAIQEKFKLDLQI